MRLANAKPRKPSRTGREDFAKALLGGRPHGVALPMLPAAAGAGGEIESVKRVAQQESRTRAKFRPRRCRGAAPAAARTLLLAALACACGSDPGHGSGLCGSSRCAGQVDLGRFGVPDYGLAVETIATDPPYYCVTFVGRDDDKGLGAEGCAGLHELGLKGQHFFRTLVGTSEQRALIVDVGANIGSHASFPAALGARVLAVEPHPYHARRLFHMAHLNDWDMRVFSGGAGSEDEFTHIHVLGGGHLVMRDPVAVGEPGEWIERRVPIAVTTLDTLLEEEANVQQVTFLKIDTDGHELQVLRGAQKWMETGPGVKYAKIEFVPYALQQGNNGDPGAAQELLRLMRAWGFTMFNIIWRGAMEGEFFCVHDLEPLRPENDEEWISRLRRIDTYAGSNILGVNASHEAAMPFDLACMPDDQ